MIDTINDKSINIINHKGKSEEYHNNNINPLTSLGEGVTVFTSPYLSARSQRVNITFNI